MAINKRLDYEKLYTRENCLLAWQLMEDHQTKAIIKEYRWVAPATVYDVTRNSATVYYRDGVQREFERVIVGMIKSDKTFVAHTMQRFAKVLDLLEKIWKAGKPLKNLSELVDFYYMAMDAWVGIDTAYFAPAISSVPETDRNLALNMRQRSIDFLEDTDKIFQLTLHKLFPKLGDYVKFITMDEVRQKSIPEIPELKKRQTHYVFYGYRIYTDTTLDKFAKQQGIAIKKEKPPTSSYVKGQVAMTGSAKGKARVIIFKKDIYNLKSGEILITTMTTPDYLPAMHKAAAFVTDEGGITCHAAIIARELGKPCVIGTKFATQIFKTGEVIEVDAKTGIVKCAK